MEDSTYNILFVEKYVVSKSTFDVAINNSESCPIIKKYLTNELRLLENNKTIKHSWKHYRQSITSKLVCLACFDNNVPVARTIYDSKSEYGSDIDVCRFKKNPVKLEKVFSYLSAIDKEDALAAIIWITSWIVPSNDIINIGFITACTKGNLDTAKYLIPFSDVYYRNNYAFRWAVVNGHSNIYQWLISLNLNIDIHSENYFALRHCCKKENYAGIKFLIDLGLDTDINSIINYKLRAKYSVDLVRYLHDLNIGFDIWSNSDYIFETVCKRNDIQLIKFYVENDNDIVPYINKLIVNLIKFQWTTETFNLFKYLLTFGINMTVETFEKNLVLAIEKKLDINFIKYLCNLGKVSKELYENLIVSCCETKSATVLNWLLSLNFKITSSILDIIKNDLTSYDLLYYLEARRMYGYGSSMKSSYNDRYYYAKINLIRDQNNLDFIKLEINTLIKHGVKFSTKNFDSYFVHCWAEDDIDTFILLTSYGYIPSNKLFKSMCYFDCPKIIKWWINNYEVHYVDLKYCFNIACDKGLLDVAQEVFQKECLVVPLYHTVYEFPVDKNKPYGLLSWDQIIPCESSRLLLLEGEWWAPYISDSFLDKVNVLEDYVFEFFCKQNNIVALTKLQVKFLHIKFEVVDSKVVSWSNCKPLVKRATKK